MFSNRKIGIPQGGNIHDFSNSNFETKSATPYRLKGNTFDRILRCVFMFYVAHVAVQQARITTTKSIPNQNHQNLHAATSKLWQISFQIPFISLDFTGFPLGWRPEGNDGRGLAPKRAPRDTIQANYGKSPLNSLHFPLIYGNSLRLAAGW